MCRGGGGAKVFDLFSKSGPGTHSHRQQTVQMDTYFFHGIGHNNGPDYPTKGNPQG